MMANIDAEEARELSAKAARTEPQAVLEKILEGIKRMATLGHRSTTTSRTVNDMSESDLAWIQESLEARGFEVRVRRQGEDIATFHTSW